MPLGFHGVALRRHILVFVWETLHLFPLIQKHSEEHSHDDEPGYYFNA